MTPLLVAFLLASNGSGKTLVRTNPGTTVPISGLSGPLILDDANTVAHVTWNGAALADSKGNAWTMNGTVPQVQKSGKTPAGSGPYSASNNYKTTLTSDAFDSSSAISVCVVVTPADTTACRLIGANNGTTGGWSMWLESSAGKVETYGTGAIPLATAATMVVGSVNVVCGGFNGTTETVKLNLGTYVSATSAALAASSLSTFLGIYGDGTSQPCSGTIYEVWATTTAPSDALFTAVEQRVKSRAGVTAW